MKIFMFLFFILFNLSLPNQAMEDENIVRGWAAKGAKQPLELHTYKVGPIGSQEVEIAVDYCGLCHTDLSFINNEFGLSQYPLIPGHEVVGKIVAMGEQVPGLKIGQTVGVGCYADSCMYCHDCRAGNNNLCEKVALTVGHPGGFAEKMRSHWAWTIPLPETLDISKAGPLMCGGATVFAPLLEHVKPIHHVGVVGIGGLGHLALQFAKAFGCHVTAFTSNLSKTEELKGFGAHRVISNKNSDDILEAAKSLDFLLVTVSTSLDWETYLQTLKPNGRMHVVGGIPEPMEIPALSLLPGKKCVSSSPLATPTQIFEMLEFAARHGIAPQVEIFPMSKVNEGLKHLEEGKARYRVVLKSDFDFLKEEK